MLASISIYGLSNPNPENHKQQFLDRGYQDSSQYTLPENPTLSDYQRAALYQNPAIKAAYAKWNSAIEGIVVAKSLPNPTMSFGYFLQNVETAVGPQEFKFGVMQMIPWLGKLSTARDQQIVTSDLALESLHSKITGLTYQLIENYLDYYYLQHSLKILNQNIDLVRNWEQVVIRKYTSSKSGHPDVIKAQIELLTLEDKKRELEARKQPLIERFRYLSGDSTLTDIYLPDSLMSMDQQWAKNDVWDTIEQANPDLRFTQLAVNLSAVSVKRTKQNFYPDFGIGLDWIITGDKRVNGTPVADSGKDPMVVMFSMQVPLWFNKNKHQLEQARMNQKSAHESFSDRRNQLKAEFEKAWFDFEDGKRKNRLYANQLIPKSIESLRASEKAYIAEKMDFLNLIDAQRRYLEFLLAYEKSNIQYRKSIAKLAQMAGGTL